MSDEATEIEKLDRFMERARNSKSFQSAFGQIIRRLEPQGFRGLRFNTGSFKYCMNILHDGELKKGWTFGVSCVLMKAQIDDALKGVAMLREYGVYLHGPIRMDDHSTRNWVFAAEAYILADDWPVLAVKRRFAGHDEKEGRQTPSDKLSTRPLY